MDTEEFEVLLNRAKDQAKVAIGKEIAGLKKEIAKLDLNKRNLNNDMVKLIAEKKLYNANMAIDVKSMDQYMLEKNNKLDKIKKEIKLAWNDHHSATMTLRYINEKIAEKDSQCALLESSLEEHRDTLETLKNKIKQSTDALDLIKQKNADEVINQRNAMGAAQNDKIELADEILKLADERDKISSDNEIELKFEQGQLLDVKRDIDRYTKINNDLQQRIDIAQTENIKLSTDIENFNKYMEEERKKITIREEVLVRQEQEFSDYKRRKNSEQAVRGII